MSLLRFTESIRVQNRIQRRDWLRFGLASSMAAACGFGQKTRAESLPVAAGYGKAKSVLLVFCNGGQSQIDTWDPKPNAPLDVRGDFAPIATAIPGVHFCEHMPRVAGVSDRLTIVRSMSHEDLDHGSAVYLALTGVYHNQRSGNPPPSPNDYPTYGAVLRRLRTSGRSLSDAIHVNGPAILPANISPGQNGGFLGRAYEPQVVGNPLDAAVIDHSTPFELPLERLEDRLAFKNKLDQQIRVLEELPTTRDVTRLYSQALKILSTPAIRDALDVTAEPPAVRERYGLHRSGQALLLARRLVEAGVPYINVIWNHSNRGQDLAPDETDLYGWDTHNDIFDALRDRLLPRFDQSFAALIEDLDQHGLLDQTLVICMGEFGRAPRVAPEPKFAGSSPGRKHWASVYSIVAAGAGVQRGAVLGASDRLGAEPATERYGPWDVAATMFHALGIDPSGHYSDTLGRPFVISNGRPIVGLYAG